MKRCLSLFLVVGLIVALAVPVSAVDGNLGGWSELLEFASVQPDGSNKFWVTGTEGKFTLDVQPERRISKVDLLISYGTGALPTYIGVDYAGTLYPLTIVDLGNNICRAYGSIMYAFYDDIEFTVRKSGTSTIYYDLLSCKISTLRAIDSKANGTLRRSYGDTAPLKLPNNFMVSAEDTPAIAEYMLVPVTITDWRKFDYITIFGSISCMALNSFRASVGNKGLPYEITYMESIPTDYDGNSWFSYEYVSGTETNYYGVTGTPDEWSTEEGFASGNVEGYSVVTYGGAVLYTVTIDLTGIDRTISGDLECYFTCIRNPAIGYGFNVQDVSGTILVADTTEVSWWNRFTGFMTELFGSKEDSGALDDLGSSSDSISDNTSQIHDFEQSQQAVLDNNFAQIQGAITFTNFAAALVFVQKYTNMTFNGISQYAIIFTLPLFLGLFFYLCSRIPGITRWKTPPPRSPSPRSKGGGKT